MSDKTGRNDPCPCGSGKKYKQCCLIKKNPGSKKKLTAKWLNAPEGPNLIERSYGNAISSASKSFTPVEQTKEEIVEPEQK